MKQLGDVFLVKKVAQMSYELQSIFLHIVLDIGSLQRTRLETTQNYGTPMSTVKGPFIRLRLTATCIK